MRALRLCVWLAWVPQQLWQGLRSQRTAWLKLCLTYADNARLSPSPPPAHRVLYCCLSLSCLLIASSSTYGLGGFLRYGKSGGESAMQQRAGAQAGGPGSSGSRSRSGSPVRRRRPRRSRGPGAADQPLRGDALEPASGSDEQGWQFFQPFSGGTVFVATQAAGWSLFSASAVVIVVLVQQLVAGVANCLQCWAISAGTLMIAAQGVSAAREGEGG